MAVKTGAKLSSINVDRQYIISFCLDLDEDVEFSPGQYARVTIKEPKYTDDRGNSRTFTLISHGSTGKQICIATRKGKSALKRTLIESPPGSEMEFTGPFGKFIVMGEENPYVFICGGIGITPALSLLCRLRETDEDKEVFIFHIGRPAGNYPLSGLVEEKLTGRQKYVRIQGQVSSKKSGETGVPILEAIMDNIPHDYMKKAILHISGPNSLVSSIKPMLIENGVAEESIKVEIFPGY